MKKKKIIINKPAPILLFVYRRYGILRKTIKSLKKNKGCDNHELYIFSDGPRNSSEKFQINKVRKYIKTISGFKKKKIFYRKKNFGLAKNIINGVSQIIKLKKKVIVIEDDLFLNKNFLDYMNKCLTRYENKKKIMHISGWNYQFKFPDIKCDIFFSRYMNCWGWATWIDRWKFYKKNPDYLIKNWSPKKINKFNLDGSYNFWSQVIRNKQGILNSWAIFWYASVFNKNGLCVNPINSLVINIGMDSFSTNTKNIKRLKNISFLSDKKIEKFPKIFKENKIIIDYIKSKIKSSFFNKVISKFGLQN